MSNRNVLVDRIPTTEPNRFLDVEVYYDAGGLNYFTGTSKKRGYYLSVTPVKVEGNCKSMLAFSGTCSLIEEVTRFSSTRLHFHATAARKLPVLQQLLNYVTVRNSLTIASETAQDSPVPTPVPAAEPVAQAA